MSFITVSAKRAIELFGNGLRGYHTPCSLSEYNYDLYTLDNGIVTTKRNDKTFQFILVNDFKAGMTLEDAKALPVPSLDDNAITVANEYATVIFADFVLNITTVAVDYNIIHYGYIQDNIKIKHGHKLTDIIPLKINHTLSDNLYKQLKQYGPTLYYIRGGLVQGPSTMSDGMSGNLCSTTIYHNGLKISYNKVSRHQTDTSTYANRRIIKSTWDIVTGHVDDIHEEVNYREGKFHGLYISSCLIFTAEDDYVKGKITSTKGPKTTVILRSPVECNLLRQIDSLQWGREVITNTSNISLFTQHNGRTLSSMFYYDTDGLKHDQCVEDQRDIWYWHGEVIFGKPQFDYRRTTSQSMISNATGVITDLSKIVVDYLHGY